MRKNKNNKSKIKPSFRKNKRTKHPAYVVDEDGNVYKYVGITHSPNTDKIDNIPLHKNPDPTDSKKAFIRPFVEKDKFKNFGRRYKNWEFSKKDKQKVDKVINKDKKPSK